jgi:hypothetical protein
MTPARDDQAGSVESVVHALHALGNRFCASDMGRCHARVIFHVLQLEE